MSENYEQYGGVTIRRQADGIKMLDVMIEVNPASKNFVVGPKTERALREYFAAHPAPNNDGYYRHDEHGMFYRVNGGEVTCVDMEAGVDAAVLVSYCSAEQITKENGFTFLFNLNGEKEDGR